MLYSSKKLLPENQLALYQTSYGQLILTKLSIGLGISLTIYGIIIGWARLKLNNFCKLPH